MTLVVSAGLHVAAVTAALLFLHAGVPVVDVPGKPAEVELVMEERKGDLGPTAAQTPSPPAPAASQAEQPAPREEPKPAPAEYAPAAVHTPVEARPDAPEEAAVPANTAVAGAEQTTAPAKASSPASAAAATPGQEAMREPDPPPPAAPPAPTISLGGTDSPSNARAWGERIIPAAPDAVFHNRPPEYPQQAALNGEHGTVVVMVHISPGGTAASVDLLQSSGFVLLDRAAREAVMRWRFLPAVRNGQPVASDMTMGFEFDNE